MVSREEEDRTGSMYANKSAANGGAVGGADDAGSSAAAGGDTRGAGTGVGSAVGNGGRGGEFHNGSHGQVREEKEELKEVDEGTGTSTLSPTGSSVSTYELSAMDFPESDSFGSQASTSAPAAVARPGRPGSLGRGRGAGTGILAGVTMAPGPRLASSPALASFHRRGRGSFGSGGSGGAGTGSSGGPGWASGGAGYVAAGGGVGGGAGYVAAGGGVGGGAGYMAAAGGAIATSGSGGSGGAGTGSSGGPGWASGGAGYMAAGGVGGVMSGVVGGGAIAASGSGSVQQQQYPWWVVAPPNAQCRAEEIRIEFYVSPAIPLTSKGREQGEALGRYLLEFQGVMFDEVFASPIPRAWETAYATCQELGFPPSLMREADELKEQSCGQWEGKNRADVFPTDASLPRITSAQPDFFCPGGESQRQVEFRMVEFLNRLAVSGSSSLLAKSRSMPPNAPPIPPYRIGIFSHSTAINQ
ncbi:unnamed protein product [Closterium sp. Yama58-4]|nr:unnamed protein product [Closterium sp. Yama58-4]